MHDDNRNKIQLEKIPKADLEGNVKVEAQGCTLARIVIAFWILGMCNNYIYVIMLSAAHDIITKVEGEHEPNTSDNTIVTAVPSVEGRNCTDLTAGAILLADIIPTLVVKLLCPFLPFYVHFRLLLAIVTGILSLVLVATSESMIMAIVGVCFASFNSGLGEITLLAYSTNFVLHAIAGWSSGTGGAGLAGSFAYAGMTESGLSPPTALFISISVPLLMAVAFWIILKHPEKEKNFFASGDSLNPSETRLTLNRDEIYDDEELSDEEEVSSDSQCGLLVEPALSLRFKAQQRYTCLCIRQGLKKTFIDKICFIPVILPYMIPVGLVYYFEYLINSGLFDKLIFTNTSMTKASQFRWYNAMYQVGVFVSRSSVTWVHFKRIWIMSILQGLNIIVFTMEAIYGFIPNVWIMFALIFWEGLLGGAAYVNTFYNMSYMVQKDQRLFALSIASVADTFGIVFAGLSSFPVHDALCKLPFKPIFRWPE